MESPGNTLGPMTTSTFLSYSVNFVLYLTGLTSSGLAFLVVSFREPRTTDRKTLQQGSSKKSHHEEDLVQQAAENIFISFRSNKYLSKIDF